MTGVGRHFERDDCTLVRERLELFLDGELTGSENFAFQTHLKECEDCAGYWADDETVSEALMVAVADGVDSGRVAAADSVEAVLARPGPEPRPITHHSSQVLVDRRLSAVWLLVTAVAASIVTGFTVVQLQGRDEVALESPAPDPVPRHLVAHTEGPVWQRRSGDSVWRPLRARESLASGAEIRTEKAAEAVLAFGPFDGAMAMAADTRVRLVDIGSEDGLMQAALDRGRLGVDVDDATWVVEAPGLVASGQATAFELELAEREGSAVVLIAVARGVVDARAERETRRLTRGQRFVLRDGVFVRDDPAPAPPAGESALDRLEHELGLARGHIGELTEENERLRSELAAVRAPLTFDPDPDPAPETAEDLIIEYLSVVDQTSYVSIARPNQYAKDAVSQLRDFGPAVVYTIEGFLLAEPIPLRRKALVGLIGGLGFDEGRDVLMRACFDDDVHVRTGAILCLKQMSHASLAGHFLEVHRRDKHPGVRLIAAYSAASHGENEGVKKMMEEYYGNAERYRRTEVVRLATKLPDDLPSVRTFLRSVVREWTSADGADSLRLAIRSLGERRDQEALPLLRDVAERMETGPDLRRFIETMIAEIEAP